MTKEDGLKLRIDLLYGQFEDAVYEGKLEKSTRILEAIEELESKLQDLYRKIK